MHMLLCLFVLGCASATDEASKRFVVVESLSGNGSGIILRTNLVLTNVHIVKAHTRVMVDNGSARVIALDKSLDLALVETNTRKMGMVKFADPKVGEDVVTVGYPIGHKGLLSYGRVTYSDFEHSLTDTLSMNGMSGSGVYNKRKRLIGITTFMEGNAESVGLPMSVQVPAAVIQKFLKEHLK